MKPAGLEEVAKAKADGRWAKAYDAPKDMQLPADFMEALSKNEKARAFFDTLNKTNRYAIGWRLQTAKKQETKEKRIKTIIEMLSNEQKFHWVCRYQKIHSIVDVWYTTADAVYRSKLIRAYVAALAQWLEEETEPVCKKEWLLIQHYYYDEAPVVSLTCTFGNPIQLLFYISVLSC